MDSSVERLNTALDNEYRTFTRSRIGKAWNLYWNNFGSNYYVCEFYKLIIQMG